MLQLKNTVKTYNASAEKVTEQLTKLEESKTAYKDAYKEFKDAKEEYYEKLKSENDSSDNNDINPNPEFSDGETYVFEGDFIDDPNLYGNSTNNINPGTLVGGNSNPNTETGLSDSSSGLPYIDTDETSVFIKE